MNHKGRVVAVTSALVCSLVASEAEAHGAAEGDRVPEDAALVDSPDKETVVKLQKQAEEEGFDKNLLTRPLNEARRALERQAGMEASADVRHASLVTSLAGEWILVARALLKAARTELKARKLAEEARELEIKAKRAQTLLAEQQAQRGRLQAQIRRLEEQSRERAEEGEKRETTRLESAAKRRAKAEAKDSGGTSQ